VKESIVPCPERAREICEQFDNVLRKCDTITYDERGAADAYALLHFLDRYHRFQVVFDALQRQKLMPKRDYIQILDVGTGPGPSMFAASDFYQPTLWRLRRGPWNVWKRESIKIDYAERSHGFRNWLHHFTELANYSNPSCVGWAVPYHHGSILDFADISFDKRYTDHYRDDDGEEVEAHYIQKSRPDLIIMSNFLTTEDQAHAFTDKIRDCAQNLRNNGVLLVVGAKPDSAKYRPVYDIIEQAVLGTGYSRRAFRAWCEKIELDADDFRYTYGDEWGAQLKRFLGDVRRSLATSLGDQFPAEVDDALARWTEKNYTFKVSWHVMAFRKRAIPRKSRNVRTYS
jgi:hypothetical protein